MIYLFDIHSTIFDEAKEYVPALKALLGKFIEEANKEITDQKQFYENVYADLRKAHIILQSDWDTRAFDVMYMHTLRSLFNNDVCYEAAKKLALTVYHDACLNCIKAATYEGMLDFLRKLKADGHHIFLCTDGNLSAVEEVIEALDLKDLIDGSYCCTSPCEKPLANKNPKVKFFSVGTFKPNVRMIGEILLDYAKENNLVSADTSYADAFTTERCTQLELRDNKWIQDKIIAKNEIFQELLNKTVMVGDSWRDIVLGKHAGVLTVEAEYGANPKHETSDYDSLKKNNLEVIEKVSYWCATAGPENRPVDRWHLFSDAKEKEIVLSKNKPDMTCHQSITEISHFSRKKVKWEDENTWKRLHQEKFATTLEKIPTYRK